MGDMACTGRTEMHTQVSKGNRPIGGHGNIWKDKTEMNLKKIGWDSMDWIHLTQDRNK
jgi:hypothetical protein